MSSLISLHSSYQMTTELDNVVDTFEHETGNSTPVELNELEMYKQEILKVATTLDKQRSSCEFDWKRVNHLKDVDQRLEHMRSHFFRDDGIVFTINPNLYHFTCYDEAAALSQRLIKTTGSSSITLLDPSFIKLLLFDLEKLEIAKKAFYSGRTTDTILKEKKKMKLILSTVSLQTQSIKLEDEVKESSCEPEPREIEDDTLIITTPSTPSGPCFPDHVSHKSKYSSIDFCATIGEVSKPITGSADEMFKKSADLIHYVEGFSDRIYQMKKIGIDLELLENKDVDEVNITHETSSKHEINASEIQQKKESNITLELESKQKSINSETQKNQDIESDSQVQTLKSKILGDEDWSKSSKSPEPWAK